MEYGRAGCIPVYSGGLDILSGDHLKASSDAEVPLVGIGLLYQNGYLQQSLKQDGWQQERNPVNDFYTLPVKPVILEDGSEMLVSVKLPTGVAQIKVWQIAVGRVKLYLLDTNIPQNDRVEHREITEQLYGGGIHTSIPPSIVLGIHRPRTLPTPALNAPFYHPNYGGVHML